MNQIDKIIAFESGELGGRETIDLFSELVRSGLAYSLQGFYGRFAERLIKAGYLDRSGTVLTYPEEED